MGLEAAEIDRIRLLLDRVADDQQVIQALRQLLPGVAISRCDASDVDIEEPFIETGTVALYFLDTSKHCVRITQDPDQASGVVVAAKR